VLDNNTFKAQHQALYMNVTCRSARVSEEIQKICFPGCEFLTVTLFRNISIKYPQLQHWDQIISERKDVHAGFHLEHLSDKILNNSAQKSGTSQNSKAHKEVLNNQQQHTATSVQCWQLCDQ
jgi:hypothetical protein